MSHDETFEFPLRAIQALTPLLEHVRGETPNWEQIISHSLYPHAYWVRAERVPPTQAGASARIRVHLSDQPWPLDDAGGGRGAHDDR